LFIGFKRTVNFVNKTLVFLGGGLIRLLQVSERNID